MKSVLLIACLLGVASLTGCMTTAQTNTTSTPTVKVDAKRAQDVQQVKRRGTYFGGGIGLGVMAF